jgi:hypothetical protein
MLCAAAILGRDLRGAIAKGSHEARRNVSSEAVTAI